MNLSPSQTYKLRMQLKVCIGRLQTVQKRDEAMARSQRRTMAQLLDVGKIESAKIRVENIIRSDITTELYEILELYCERLLARVGLLAAEQLDPGLEEAVKTIMYAAPKTEIRDLQQVRTLLIDICGKDFTVNAMENKDQKVSERVLKKLSVAPPREELVQGYLEEIARAYGVDWPKRPNKELGEPPEFVNDDVNDDNPNGGQAQKVPEPVLSADDKPVQPGKTQSLATTRPVGSKTPLQANPSTGNLQSKVTPNLTEPKLDKIAADTAVSKTSLDRKGTVGGIPGLDELAARFAALKR
ncbi:DUF292-domain-containing protein [Hypoxylon sp. NC1633]|nr:DUF292-domain-containing protein [Hypoxylon sp. NC1633]